MKIYEIHDRRYAVIDGDLWTRVDESGDSSEGPPEDREVIRDLSSLTGNLEKPKFHPKRTLKRKIRDEAEIRRILWDYKNGVAPKDIQNKYGISGGSFYSLLKNHRHLIEEKPKKEKKEPDFAGVGSEDKAERRDFECATGMCKRKGVRFTSTIEGDVKCPGCGELTVCTT